MGARDTLSSATIKPSTFVQPSNLFSTPQPLSSTAPISSLNPKINRVCSVTSSIRVMTFTEPLIVLDTQSSFDHIFGLHPTMIRIIFNDNMLLDTGYFALKVLEFCNLCHLLIFDDSVKLKYVGAASYD